jgi:hypothetical protein
MNRKSYRLAFKLKLIREAESSSVRKVAKTHKVSRKVLRAMLVARHSLKAHTEADVGS